MAETTRYLATLRCRTWHSWPEHVRLGTNGCPLPANNGIAITAAVGVATYLPRSAADSYVLEASDEGPLVWRGEVPGLYALGGAILKAPEDTVAVALEHERARKGEVDLFVAADAARPLAGDIAASFRGIASALLAMLNLRLQDHLTPSAPLQVRRLVSSGTAFENSVVVAVQRRDEPPVAVIEAALQEFQDVVLSGRAGAKIQTALELYSAQSIERDSKVRFLLLVMALECLSTATPKHPVALDLIAKWQGELKKEQEGYPRASEEFLALESLERELLFRRNDSIRSQVRALMARVKESSSAPADLARRALRVYDIRSTLVHEGDLPPEDLANAEREAKEFVETALQYLLITPRNSPDPG